VITLALDSIRFLPIGITQKSLKEISCLQSVVLANYAQHNGFVNNFTLRTRDSVVGVPRVLWLTTKIPTLSGKRTWGEARRDGTTSELGAVVKVALLPSATTSRQWLLLLLLLRNLPCMFIITIIVVPLARHFSYRVLLLFIIINRSPFSA